MYKQCKTSQSIERQRQIGKTLIRLMKKQPYSKISVSEICRESYISRNVFYKYFDCMEDVFIFVADELVLDLSKFASDYAEQESRLFTRESERFFIYWYQQRHILNLIIKNNLLEVLFDRIIENACEHLIGVSLMPDEMPDEYYPVVINFSLYGIMSLLINWYRQNYETSPEKMAEAFYYLITNPLFKPEKR